MIYQYASKASIMYCNQSLKIELLASPQADITSKNTVLDLQNIDL